MESFLELLAECSGRLDARSVYRIIEHAKVVVDTKLRQPEIDEFLNAFLNDPVNLLHVVSERRSQDTWSKVVGDIFDLLARLLADYSDFMQPYMESIVKVCAPRTYGATARRKATRCLAALARCGVAAPSIAPALPALLDAQRRGDEALSCRVPLAQLIGSICEHHPSLIEDHVSVWRSYCAVLEVNKTTDTLAAAVLSGVAGLFKNFGNDLPTADLNAFAHKLFTKYIHCCEAEVLGLVSGHADLFPEVLAAGAEYRGAVWSRLAGGNAALAADTLVAVYAAVGKTALRRADRSLVADIIWKEVWERSVRHPSAPAAFLRAAWAVVDACGPLLAPADVARLRGHTALAATRLELALGCAAERLLGRPRGADWEYDKELVALMEQVSWCVSRVEGGSADALLRQLIQLQGFCPRTRRRQFVAASLLGATPLSRGIVSYLITESCRPPADPTDPPSLNIDKHMALWTDLFDPGHGTDSCHDDRRRLFDEFVDCLLDILGVYLEKRELVAKEESTLKLSALLELSSRVFCVEYVEDWLQESAAPVLTAVLDCAELYGQSEGLVGAVVALVRVTDRLCLLESGGLGLEVMKRTAKFYRGLSPERCRDERVLVSVCRALVLAPLAVRGRAEDLQVALQVIFSRKDVEPALLGRALLCLTESAASHNRISETWFLELKARVHRWARVGTENRTLRRSIDRFLAKFPSSNEGSSNMSETGALGAGEVFRLTLPDPAGRSHKLNLEKLFDIAVLNEDAEALCAFLLMLCSAAANEELSAAVASCLHKLTRCWSRGELETSRAALVEQAALWHASASTLRMLVALLTCEKSPGVRKLLSGVLETVLKQDPLAEESQARLAMVTETAVSMLRSEDSTSKKAGLDIVEALMPALRENNEFSKSRVPVLLSAVLGTRDADFVNAYDLLSKYFEEKIVIYERGALEVLGREVLEAVFEITDTEDFGLHERVVEKSLLLAKLVAAQSDDGGFCVSVALRYVGTEIVVCLYAMAVMRAVFVWDDMLCRQLVAAGDFSVLNVMTRFSEEIGAGTSVGPVAAVYKFLGEFSVFLVECQYEKTSKILANLLTRQPVQLLRKCRHEISECFKKYRDIWSGNVPKVIEVTYRQWYETLPVKEITDKMKFCRPTFEHIDAVCTLKLTLQVLNFNDIGTTLQVHTTLIRQWPGIVKSQVEPSGAALSLVKIAYLTDALTVALLFMDEEEVVTVVCQSLTFYRKFEKAFCPYLLKHQKVLFSDGLRPVLNGVVETLLKYVVKEQVDWTVFGAVEDLVDELWPTLESTSSVAQLTQILADLSLLDCSSLTLESRPGAWLLRAMARPELGLMERVQLMEALPVVMKRGVGAGAEAMFLSAVKRYEATLPLLPSELTARATPRALRALLLALAATADVTLLAVAVKISISEATAGWWCGAIERCVEALAAHGGVQVADALYRYTRRGCDPDATVLLLERLLVPLLQCSTQSFCEGFFTDKLKAVLDSMRRVSAKPQKELLVEYVVAFTLARVMFEKVSCEALESSGSALHSRLGRPIVDSWWCVREVCAVSVSLRKRMSVVERPAELRTYFRLFHCANYNCLAAALCKRRPALKFYNPLFDESVWPLVVDCDTKISRWGPLDAANKGASLKRHSVSVPLEGTGAGAGSPESNSLLTLRRTGERALFLRTLSDDVLQYDFLQDAPVEETTTAQSLLLTDSELNNNECAATLTAVLSHLVTLSPASERPAWLEKMAATMTAVGTHRNVKAFLCQLSTIFHWSEANRPASLPDDEAVLISESLSFLINNVLKHRSITKILTGHIEALCKRFGSDITLVWAELWTRSMTDAAYSENAIQIWIILVKFKVNIPDLLALVDSSMELEKSTTTDPRPRRLAELYGLAAASCQNAAVRSDSLARLRRRLDRVRAKSAPEYIALLYYAQLGHAAVCDEDHFRIIVELAPKMPLHPKNKCFRIISNYIASLNSPSEAATDMFHTVNITELVTGGDHLEAGLMVAKHGVSLMEESLRRRIVFMVMEYCGNPVVKIRKLAYEVLLAALDHILEPDTTEPSAKRPRSDMLNSRVLQTFHRDSDPYSTRVLAALGRGLTDTSGEIAKIVYERIETHLSASDINARFCECMLAVFLLPSSREYLGDDTDTATGTSAGRPRTKSRPIADQPGRLGVFLRLLLERMRSNEYYRRMKLRDAPLKKNNQGCPVASGSSVSKLMTLSTRYQGTFRSSPSGSRGGHKLRIAGTSAVRSLYPDVQVPIDDLLKAFLDMTEHDVEAAKTLYLDTYKSLLERDLGGELRRTSAILFARLLQDGARQPAAILEATRLCVAECFVIDGFASAVTSLTAVTRGTASEQLVALLYEDVLLQRPEESMFQWRRGCDEEAVEEKLTFSIEGMMEAFDLLGDWGQLTVAQKRRAAKEMAPLWTTHCEFEAQLRGYFERPDNLTRLLSDARHGWLARCYSVLVGSRQSDHDAWLKSACAWPVHGFNVRATAEAIEWHEVSSHQKEWNEVVCGNAQFQQGSDNLAESASLLMFRSLIARTVMSAGKSSDPADVDEGVQRACRGEELRWSELAAAAGLTRQVIECSKRNFTGLYQSEILSWLVQKTRCELLEERQNSQPNHDALGMILKRAEESKSYGGQFAPPESVLEMSGLILTLMAEVDEAAADVSAEVVGQSLEKMSELAREMESMRSGSRSSDSLMLDAHRRTMVYCDAMLDGHHGDPETSVALIDAMTASLGGAADCARAENVTTWAAMALRRQTGFETRRAKILLRNLEKCASRLDSTVLDVLRQLREQSWAEMLAEYPMLTKQLDGGASRQEFFVKCLSSLRDPTHSMNSFCYQLMAALEKSNESAWRSCFDAMRSELNMAEQTRGLAYQLLEPYWRQLRAFETYEATPQFHTNATKVIQYVERDIRRMQSDPKCTLSLGELSPVLARFPDGVSEQEGRCLRSLLGVEAGVEIVRFERQVHIVQLNSLHRPVLIAAVLSDGSKRRYLVKTGEDLRYDATCQRVQRYLNDALRQTRLTIRTYKVTPLSETAGVMEYIEDCCTLRSKIGSGLKVETSPSGGGRRPPDKELIRMQAAAIASHWQAVSSTPATALRSAIEAESTSVEHFIRLKRAFLESLAAMTVSHWILGLGDRHLENFLYHPQEGWLCAVDWNCILGQGASQDPPELQPARLTRQMLAVNANSTSVLEGLMQSALGAMRVEWRPLFAACALSFRWAPGHDGDTFQAKLGRVRGKLSGGSLSFRATLEELGGSPERAGYSALLEAVGGALLGEPATAYSVEQQVAALLQHCTSAELLAVSRSGWEPWL